MLARLSDSQLFEELVHAARTAQLERHFSRADYFEDWEDIDEWRDEVVDDCVAASDLQAASKALSDPFH